MKLKIVLLSMIAFAATGWGSLLLTPVTGQMLILDGPPNYFDPANGFVPAGYLNDAGPTVTIDSPAIEFGFADGANTDTADFDAATLVLTDVSVGGSIDITYVFTDAAFSGYSISLASNTFPAGFTASLVDSVLTISAPSISSGGTYATTIDFVAVPEPGAGILVACGGAILFAFGSRKIRSAGRNS